LADAVAGRLGFRESVTKSVSSVLNRIAQSDARLGNLLSRCIKTGTFCSYQPDPALPIAWEFAATSGDSPIEPVEQSTSTRDPNPIPARTDASPLLLEVFPFSLAERTAFAGRETERRGIHAMIDRALSGRGSLVMLGSDQE
jgi:hypothetical protein